MHQIASSQGIAGVVIFIRLWITAQGCLINKLSKLYGCLPFMYMYTVTIIIVISSTRACEIGRIIALPKQLPQNDSPETAELMFATKKLKARSRATNELGLIWMPRMRYEPASSSTHGSASA